LPPTDDERVAGDLPAGPSTKQAKDVPKTVNLHQSKHHSEFDLLLVASLLTRIIQPNGSEVNPAFFNLKISPNTPFSALWNYAKNDFFGIIWAVSAEVFD
jgi:hypothetical protein